MVVMPQVYPGMDPAITLMDQCVAEQRFVRGAQLRALIYAQVGFLGEPGTRGRHGTWQV